MGLYDILLHITGFEICKNKGEAMEKDYPRKIHGIKIKSIASICMVICIILLAVTYRGIFHVDKSYRELAETAKKCAEGQKCAVSMEHSSDYLTDEVRLFAMGKDKEHMYHYFEEIDSNNRENVVQKLEEICGETDPDAVQRLKEALKESNELEELEIHAMRLMSFGMKLDESELPKPVAEWKMTQQELAMTERELELACYDLVFGSEYLKSKTKIKRNTADAFELLIQKMEKRQEESGTQLEKMLTEQRVYTFLMIVLIGVVFWLIGILLIYPMSDHIRSIQANRPWKDVGGYEMRYLADVYNRLYTKNELYQEELQYKVEHDALTGICNREAFEQKKDLLREKNISIALLLVDVDEFKNVNDSMGHETGDEALCRIADVLKQVEAENSYCVARIGGDEFAIILMNTTEEDFPKIQADVDHINNEICKGNDGLPPLSISVGAAFSDKGYSNNMFHEADMALYHTKQSGRKGCSRYQENMG